MPSSRQKGKIAAAEWPAIVARHKAGEALTSIARAYGCTAPAIRYIVGRAGAGAARPALDVGKRLPLVLAAPRSSTASTPLGLLRERVMGEIAAFLYVLDSATSQPDAKTLEDLRAASDRLMRAAARVRIELDRVTPMEAEAGGNGSSQAGAHG